MFKKLLSSLFFLSFAFSAGMAIATSNQQALSVRAEGDEDDPNVLHGYTYTDSDTDYMYFVRTFDSRDIAPHIIKTFCAPSGYTLSLELSNEQVEEMIEQCEFACPGTPSMVDVICYYSVAGTDIYMDSDPFWPESRDEVRDRIWQAVDSFEAFDVENLTTTTTMRFDLYIEYYVKESDRGVMLRFLGEPFVMEPYDELDFLQVSAFYYVQVGNDERVTVSADVIEGFFCERNDYDQRYSYNAKGWHTDEIDHQGYEYDYYAVAQLSFYANDSILLGSGGRFKSIEMSLPPEPLSITARMTFVSNGETHTYYSKPVEIGDPHMGLLVDGYANRTTIQRNREYTLSFNVDSLDIETMTECRLWADLYPYRLSDPDLGHELYADPHLPEKGITGHYYYIPTEEELEDYRAGKPIDPESPAFGQYYIWNGSAFVEYNIERVFFSDYNPDWNPETGNVDDLSTLFINQGVKVPFIGRWTPYIEAYITTAHTRYFMQSNNASFWDVVVSGPTDHRLELNVPNDLHLIQGGGSVEIIPSVIAPEGLETDYYYYWDVNKEGVLELIEGEDGHLTINAIGHGVVTLTVSVESALFAPISKTITVRVLDTVFDVAKVEVPDEFHYAGKDLTAALSVRGFTVFQNLEVEWAIEGKDGAPVGEEKYLDNKDATLTIPKAERNDYKITASYEGIELDSIVVEVRSININQFLRVNIWWIVLITLGFVALMLIMRRLLSRGKTTVESIERVYQVFCSCYADDKLTLPELKRIKREINRCVSRCEDLNIEALNQYEKAIRYLKKSSKDTQALMSGWETISPEDKSAGSERLDKDLSKALNVAKEIENAKQLIEQYHDKANRSNYEKLDDGKGKKGK